MKGGTREKHGKGIQQQVSGSAKFPGNWKKFLTNDDSKKELFSFLSKKIIESISLMTRVSTSHQVSKCSMLETVHLWISATMRKLTRVS